jgi:hypothetical protein
MNRISFTEQLRAFYPEYLEEHDNRTNKILHFIGATATIALLLAAVISGTYWLIPVAIFIGYLLPGIGHKHFQKNNSFRVTKPTLCVACAFLMYLGLWSGKVKF